MIVVIPTNRSIRLDYLQPLIDAGARFVIVDDSEGSVAVAHPQFRVYTWADRRRMLGELDIAMPRRNGACRDFGFYVAWQEAEADEIIVALDDDCRVEQVDFAARAAHVLSPAPRPQIVAEQVHLNILDLYADVPANLFPRGFPYSARLGQKRCRFGNVISRPVQFSLGLWQGIFDVNAIDKLQGPAWRHENAALQHESVLLPAGSLVSLCSMNMVFRRAVIPAVYQLPMHVEVMPGWVIDRYGDIWGGFILKALMDRCGEAVAAGGPMIRHLKEGDFRRNIWQEHLCHLVNDEFVDVLLRAATDLRPASYLEMIAELTESFRRVQNRCSGILSNYFSHLTAAMTAWVHALSR